MIFSKRLLSIVAVSLVLVLDQISKFAVRNYYSDIITINQRGTWGILPWWVSLVGLVVLGGWLLQQKQQNILYWIILAAGLSNLVDRIIYNGVIDWIHTFSWFPVFNLADFTISIGVIFLLIYELVLTRNKPI